MRWLRAFVERMNSLGVPLPMVRDPKTGAGSVSLTMVVVSFFVAVMGLIGKISKFLGDVDMSQTLWLLTISSSLYFGRKLSVKPPKPKAREDKNVEK